jgi:hypothetical protein
MSKTEIESEFRAMTQTERLQMAELLGFLIRENDPDYQTDLDESRDRMEQGQKVPETYLAKARQRGLAEG